MRTAFLLLTLFATTGCSGGFGSPFSRAEPVPPFIAEVQLRYEPLTNCEPRKRHPMIEKIEERAIETAVVVVFVPAIAVCLLLGLTPPLL